GINRLMNKEDSSSVGAGERVNVVVEGIGWTKEKEAYVIKLGDGREEMSIVFFFSESWTTPAANWCRRHRRC
ncbi:hypothetical protein NLK98_26840, partial [Klebsiella pneumoniae]|nr:hypothetical protein [Klebsiella pneumoniae]